MFLHRKVATRYIAQTLRHVARTFNLQDWDLDGLSKGERVTLYHGTTSSFQTFDPQKSRTELVDKYYGAGIFLTPSKKVAWKYADANRNTGFDPSIIDDLKTKNAKAAEILGVLFQQGSAGWDTLQERFRPLAKDGEGFAQPTERYMGGVDLNHLADVCNYIIGRKPLWERDPDLDNDDDTLAILMGHSPTGTPPYLFDLLDDIGLDSAKYRPKVYTVSVLVENPLVTANRAQARGAKKKGYDCVVYYGTDLVDRVPEVAVFNPHKVKITHVDVGD